MAFGRLERARSAPPMSDINMTPLIDVMLVLLVIFMIAAPLMGSTLRLDLPEAAATAPADTAPFVGVAIDAQGRFFLGDAPIAADALHAALAETARRDPLTEVQLRADRRVAYGRVAELLELVQRAGLSRIGFVTEPAHP